MKKKPQTSDATSPLASRIATLIHRHTPILADDKVIVAVSAGSDSLALLYLLHEINLSLNLVASYIDHGLRPQETPLEKKAIADICLALNVPFSVKTVDVHRAATVEKRSLEDAARTLRYTALEETRHEYGGKYIATGHTADDQVEEFFLRLIRGSGKKGLSGMAIRRDKIIRPLLLEEKATLIDYLRQRGISWCNDTSNLNRQFLRNRIRLELLPLLEDEFNPAIRRIILQYMDISAKEDTFLEEKTVKAYRRCVNTMVPTPDAADTPQLCIKGQEFLDNHLAIQRRVIEKSCWQLGIRPSYSQIYALINLLAKTDISGGVLHLKDGVVAERSGQDLVLVKGEQTGRVRTPLQKHPTINRIIAGPGKYSFSLLGKELVLKKIAPGASYNQDTIQLRVDLAKIRFPLLLRSSIAGERFHPYGSPGKKKIGRYFTDRKIAKANRPAWPVLLCGDRVVALPGLQIDHEFRLKKNSTEILMIDWRDSET